jgi:hypothetical protein
VLLGASKSQSNRFALNQARLSVLSGEVFIGVERTWTCAKERPEQDASEHNYNKWLGAREVGGQATRGALSLGRQRKERPTVLEI